MNLLKKENWWCWVILVCASFGTAYFVLGALTDVYDKDAWYAKPAYWIIGTVCALLPAIIMLFVFAIQITAAVAAKLNTPGKEIYLSPYTWIILLIIPIIGWILFVVLLVYIYIWNLAMIARGMGEIYI